MRVEMAKQKAIQEEEARKLQELISHRDSVIFNLDQASVREEILTPSHQKPEGEVSN